MSQAESKEPSQLGDHPAYGEAPRLPEADSWERRILPMLWFTIPYGLLLGIFRTWLPWFAWYQAVGISCFAAGLVAFRARYPRLRRYGFGKYLIYYLVVSAGFSILTFAMEALVSAFRR
ncbi:MAG TPA: hypothetical protein VNO24_24120 [Blastocatellia bacterium]|nr:hypothetical protein [Blastocatellia bacterium]